MAGEDQMDETTVSERYAVTIPKAIRDRLDVEPGDTLRWTVTDDDELTVEVMKQRTGALEGFDPVD